MTPPKRMREVNVARVAVGLDPQFNQVPLMWFKQEVLTKDLWAEEPETKTRTVREAHTHKRDSYLEIIVEKIQ